MAETEFVVFISKMLIYDYSPMRAFETIFG